MGRLARKITGRDPRVRRWDEGEDVLQTALPRALETVRPEPTRSSSGLTAEQIGRELPALPRHFYGPTPTASMGHRFGGTGGCERSRPRPENYYGPRRGFH